MTEGAAMSHLSATPPRIPDHELLHCIGAGSYGEVWFARNVAGTPRAVKIVYRSRFTDDRPYTREFNGLKHFEPVSRTHAGLVDILQIGRNDADGFFYYVMELADRAKAPGVTRHALATDDVTLDTLTPLTLESRIRTEGRLPVKDCVAIARMLAEALAHLHAHGLVHRDIKPSNIILVSGVPKLADVGLVARAGDARTFVGTEGFIPPEGPGTPQADIYSLGKCVYEMAMGKDRQAFPSPPTLLDEFPDRAELLELNQIIAAACDPQPSRRYRSAAALAQELAILQDGRSVMKARRRRAVKNAALAVSGLLGAAAMTWLGNWALRQPRLEVVRLSVLPNNWPAREAKAGHYFNSNSLEFFATAGDAIGVASLEGDLLMRGTLPGSSRDAVDLHLLADTDGDGRDEAFVSWREGTNLFVSVFNQNGVERRRFTAFGSMRDGPVAPSPISRLWALKFFSPTATNPPAVLLSLETGKPALSPRALRLCNYTNGATLWEFHAPSMPTRQILTVPDGSPAGAIVVGTQSHNNGAQAEDGTDDRHSYLYALSAEGALLWRTNLGPELSQTMPQLATIGGSKYLFALVCRKFESTLEASEPPTNAWQSRLLKLTTDGREVARFSTAPPMHSFAAVTQDGPNPPLLLAACADGTLLQLDPVDLRLLRRTTVIQRTADWVELEIVAIADLDRDGQREIVLNSTQVRFVSGTNTSNPEGEANVRHYEDRCVIVLNDQFRQLARHDFQATREIPGPKVITIRDPKTGDVEILALDKHVTALRFRRR